MKTIEARILDAPIEGINLTGGTLRDQLGGEAGSPPTLLVFLRHLG
jgi:hypothetical protein